MMLTRHRRIQSMVRPLLAALAAVGTSCGGGGGSGESARANLNSPLGVNINRFSYYNPEWVFTDAFKQAMTWLPEEANSNVWNTGYPLTLNADGWPILGTNPDGNPEAAGTAMFSAIAGHYPAGVYVCLYDGTGTIEIRSDAFMVSQKPGRIELEVDTPTDAGIGLKVSASDPNDPVRNIRVIMPGFESTYTTQLFHPVFLDRIKRYKVLRFMDVQRTNGSIEQDWADRTKPTWYTQGDNNFGSARGPAIEYLIALCNAAKADPWFCIPHEATDDYVTQFATLVRDNLDPDLKVWIEYSNEIWNGAFAQYAYCADQGFQRGYDSSAGVTSALRFQAARSVEIFQIWENVFASHERLVRVLSGQMGNPGVGTSVMDWHNAYQSADAFAIGTYFGAPDITPQNAPQMTVADVIVDMYSGIDTVMTKVDQNRFEANARNLPLVAYEGGQSLVGTDNVTRSLFAATNRDPGIYAPYLTLLDQWKAHGGTTFMHFTSSSLYDDHGYWGSLEYQDQDVSSAATAPKYGALRDFITANPRWW